jgi:hypothetical protein
MNRDDGNTREAQRRRLLQAGLGAAALGALPGVGQLAARAQAPFDWKNSRARRSRSFSSRARAATC